MREELIAYLKTLKLGQISSTDELPWAKDGSPLYLKNFRKIYIAQPDMAQEPVIMTLNGSSIVSETTTIVAYLAVDAKNTPSNYDSVVATMQAARNEVETGSRLDRTCSVAKSFEADALVTEFTFSFRKLLTL